MASLSLSTGMVCFAFGRATWSFKELSMSVLQSLSVYMHEQTFCIAWLVGTQQVQNDVGHWYGHDAQHSQDSAGIHWWHTWWAWLSWILYVCGSDIIILFPIAAIYDLSTPGFDKQFQISCLPHCIMSLDHWSACDHLTAVSCDWLSMYHWTGLTRRITITPYWCLVILEVVFVFWSSLEPLVLCLELLWQAYRVSGR